MPTFDFECAKCGNVFEFSRPFGSKEHPACPSCKSKKTEKQFSTPTVVFKGEGWYKTAGRKAVSEGQKVEEKGEVKKDEAKKDSNDSKESKASNDAKKSEPAKKPEPKK